MIIANHQTLDRICATAGSELYHARRLTDGMAMLLKWHRPEHANAAQSARFRSEYRQLQSLNVAGADLVLTDQTMPDLNGVDLAREIRPVRPELPVLLMSGYSGAQLTERARAAGVADLLRKPLVRRDIAEALGRALRRPQCSHCPS